jgi:hypothetical protein
MNPKIELTADRLWNPSSEDFEEKERKLAPVVTKASHAELLLPRDTERQICAARAAYNATMNPLPYGDELS